MMMHTIHAFNDCRAARAKLREEFLRNKAVTDPKSLATIMKGIDEVEDMLLHNIVQVSGVFCLHTRAHVQSLHLLVWCTALHFGGEDRWHTD